MSRRSRALARKPAISGAHPLLWALGIAGVSYGIYYFWTQANPPTQAPGVAYNPGFQPGTTTTNPVTITGGS
jgi:hypothetical protein